MNLQKGTSHEAREIFTDMRVFLVKKENLVALVSCKVADAVWITGMRVVEGTRGKFVSMPTKKDSKGEYQDLFFPANREVREALQCAVLKAYQKTQDEADQNAREFAAAAG